MTSYAINTNTIVIDGHLVTGDKPEVDTGPRALAAFVGLAQRGGLSFEGVRNDPLLYGSRCLVFTEDTGSRRIEHLVLAWASRSWEVSHAN